MPASRKARAAGFRWLLVGLILGCGCWVWWQARQTPAPKTLPEIGRTNPPAVLPAVPAAPAVTAAPPVVAIVQTSPPVVVVPAPLRPPVPIVTSAPPATVVRSNSPAGPDVYPRRVQNGFEAQLALARRAISSGSMDGVMGSQTRAALQIFQHAEGIPETGELDPQTKARLLLDAPPLTTYTVSSNDLARLQPISPTWLGKSQQSALDYETILELVAERAQSAPNLLRRLNPGLDWDHVATGTPIEIPNVAYPVPTEKAALIRIHLARRALDVFDGENRLQAHFPCSIAQRMEKRPVGELHVAVVAPNPNYTFNPEVFPESEEARQLGRKLILPPGPNNPVGVAWIGLDRAGYGIHGTPSPEQVGRTESHGCFRLANWNAEYLLKLVWVGLPVMVEP